MEIRGQMGVRQRRNDIVNSLPIPDRASLSGIRRAIRRRLYEVEADPALTFDCLVAVTEACTNALVHGMRERGPLARISWEIDAGRALFHVEDYSSREWSKAAHPSRRVLEPSGDDDLRVGGFGLEIMDQLMDEVAIQIGPAGTSVMMTKVLE
jgi:serine/threonine-protein kinase RsbW